APCQGVERHRDSFHGPSHRVKQDRPHLFTERTNRYARLRPMRPIPVANPPNPWASTEIEWIGAPPEIRLRVFEDHTREILSRNDSPDLGFRYSVNPYRGCFHGCAYCYARPTHEYLGFGAGSDFERQIVVK